MMATVKFFAMILSLVGAAPKDAPTTLQLQQGDVIVAMGDSITAGGGYLTMTHDVLAQQYPDLKIPKIINAGISGHKAEDMVARFEKDVVAKKPAVVTINVGVNDVWHRLKEPHDAAVLAKYKENVARMVELAQKAGAKVILLAPTIIQEDPKAEGNVRLTMYVAAMKEVAAQKQCAFVDLHAMFLEALSKRPAALPAGKNWLTVDGVHMNAMGNGIMAVGVLRAMGVSDEKIAASDGPVLPAMSATSRPAAHEALTRPAHGTHSGSRINVAKATPAATSAPSADSPQGVEDLQKAVNEKLRVLR